MKHYVFFYSQIVCKQDNGAKQMVCNRKFKSKIMACVWRKPRCSVLIQYFGFSPGLNRKKIFFPLFIFFCTRYYWYKIFLYFVPVVPILIICWLKTKNFRVFILYSWPRTISNRSISLKKNSHFELEIFSPFILGTKIIENSLKFFKKFILDSVIFCHYLSWPKWPECALQHDRAFLLVSKKNTTTRIKAYIIFGINVRWIFKH